jgi:hypothetical protein
VTEEPLAQLSSTYGPVPMGLLAACAALFGCRMTAVFSPRRNGIAASAVLKTRMTLCASATTTLERLSHSAFLALLVLVGAFARSKLNFTALASNGEPSLNLMPFFSRKV